MYKNRSKDLTNNLIGKKLKNFRQKMSPKLSQRALADLMQLNGIDIDKNAIQRIEAGKRFVTDIELRIFAKVLKVSYEELLD